MDSSEEPRGIFLVIDNKSFYATIECTMRGLDPLTTPLVVMSEAENTNGGLVLASSPMAKKLYGISNVNRQRDLPRDNHLIVVPPRMNTYIEKNIEVNNIYREFVADEDLLPYSIDESILDITHSWKLFGDDPIAVVKKIQKTVHDRLKLVRAKIRCRPRLRWTSMPSMIHASLARLPMTRSKIGIDFFMVKLNK